MKLQALKLVLAFGFAVILAMAVLSTPATADGPTLDPANADALAHQALIQPTDLPGSGWQTTETDVFSGDDASQIPDTPACRNSQLIVSQTSTTFDAKYRAGRAEIQVSLDDAAGIGVQISNEVDVYQTGADLPGVFSKLKPIVLSSDYAQCLKDALAAALNDNTLKETDGKLLGNVPSNGVARAFDLSIGSVNVSLHVEFYIWQYGNATEQIQVFGNKDTLTPDMVNAALSTAQGNIKNAASQ